MRYSALRCAVALLCLLCSQAAARVPDSDPYVLTGGDIAIDPWTQWKNLPAACRANNVSARADETPPISSSTSYWGPNQYDYASVGNSTVPAGCNPTAWAWSRVLAAINYTIALDINYCHHHSPWYDTPAAYKTNCGLSTSTDTCSCNVAPANKKWPWRGLDCSNFAAFVYNVALGYYPTSAIGTQACADDNAPGRLLSTVTLSKLDQLAPGDLVFITVSKSSGPAPARVSHVVLWTGYTVDFTPGATGPLANATLINNLPSIQRTAVVKCQKAQLAKNLPVYVLADSTNTGPNFRPFCGWYFNSFSHARRIINPSATLPTNDASIAYYDAANADCMSLWALQDGLV